MSETRPVKRRRKRKVGRPSKLTPEVRQRILAAIRAGAPAKTACIGSGVGESTFYGWLERAEDPDSPPEYRAFATELAEAREAGQIARIARITKAGQTDWRADAWLCERVDPANFSVRYRLEYGGRVQVNVGALLNRGLREPLDVVVDPPGALPAPEEE